ncbi:ArsA family ATPase [Patescibacteria group bacterium]|nr:ArsA family ATPase [Patescibacteria group bacterium]
MALNKLYKKNLQFILFGGKGGVGKTTMAAASAIRFAKKRGKTLIFTTDPAPSLADSFEQSLSNEPQAIKGVKNLYGMEIDAKKVLEEFKEEYGEEILDILQKGTYLSDKENEEVFSLDIPGLDEIMGLKKIIDFMESEEYDLYIVDTAPTGHTLRLLALPELLDDWIKFLARTRWRYRYMVKRFSGKEKIEKADEFLLEMKKTVKRVRNLLQDSDRTEFIIITIPEAMAVHETEDLVNDLQKFKIPCSHIVINNIFPKNKCQFCQSRRGGQEKYISQIKTKFKGFDISQVPLQSKEIRGVEELDKLTKILF